MFDHEQRAKELQRFAKFGELSPSTTAVQSKLGKHWMAPGMDFDRFDDMAERFVERT